MTTPAAAPLQASDVPGVAMPQPASDDVSLLVVLTPLARRWGRLIVVPTLVAAAAVAATYLMTPTFQAGATLLPPQPPQSAAASALASLGALGALLPTGSAGGRASADLYVSLMQSSNATDRIIDKFDLLRVYEVPQRWQARRDLAKNTSIALGKKDGLITVAVEDASPKRAADIANQYVDELRRLSTELALNEAQERRSFYEGQLQRAKDGLAKAQADLQASGYTVDALKAEPKAAAESYAKLRAELTAAEVRLQAMRSSLTDTTPEVRSLQDTVAALRSELARSEAAQRPPAVAVGKDYISKYREFKYQETLYELMVRQYESARVDESRPSALVQVIDAAVPPEHKLRPKRAYYAVGAWIAAFVLYAIAIVVRGRLANARQDDPVGYARWLAFKAAWRGG